MTSARTIVGRPTRALPWLSTILSLAAGFLAGRGAETIEPILADERINWEQARQFWAFQVPRSSPLPAVQNLTWPRQPMDFFVLARMEKEGLTPAPATEPATLLRRVTFDLTGLPPTPEQVSAFRLEVRPDAYERWVERLLASPGFGERQASLWLPLARYAEDQAHQVGDDTAYFYPNAWRYRAWVIDAFNRDLPYDRFLKLQIAADRFADAPNDDLAALGFLGLGPKYYDRGRLAVMAEEWEDRVDTVCRTMLGLTVACARCHDHKFDPITTRDYYALAGVFASTRMVNRTPDGREEPKKTTAAEIQPGTVHIVAEGETKSLPVFLRGNVDRPGPLVERRFLQVLSGDPPTSFFDNSGRRELAEAIASATNPLTARVMVNRVWAQLFGRPLVGTPSNFGNSGSPPTHPMLLDNLSTRFMDGGWSVKDLVREIVLSATYRQSSRLGPVDPANEFLSRVSRRRLTIEQWRDAVLAVCGELEVGDRHSRELSDPENRRRTVYARISRLQLDDLLLQFDYPDANVHAEKRNVTTTATQKLFVLNSPFMQDRARALAARLDREAGPTDAARIQRAYRLLFGRPADAEELRLGREFLSRPAAGAMSRREQYAQLLLASNEMTYVD